MKLNQIRETVTSVADAISNVLEIDVIVVDTDLKIIGNTYKYLLESDTHISNESIIGKTLRDNEKQIVIDNNTYEKCRMCKSREQCKLCGMISIPIRFKEEVVGAIGIMLYDKRMESRFASNLEGITTFLERMSELLSSKLVSVDQVNKIERVNKEIEHIITNVKDGIIYLDNDDRIDYYNNKFKEYFQVDDSIKGKKVDDVLEHTIISNYLYTKKNISDKIFVFQDSNVSFKGLISCVNTNHNSDFLGTMITFRKIEETHTVMNELLNNKSNIKFDQLIYDSEGSSKAVEWAKKLAIEDGDILISGDCGTGKETLAYCIHNFSARKSKYVISVDCKFMSRSYYLSELFGIGQSRVNTGKFQLADKGTIILNEIANLPLNIQNDLLSYLSKGEIRLEKGIVIKDIDVRIIATTRHDLRQKIKEGSFNEELFFRINNNPIDLKNLNSRDKEEFAHYVEYFLDIYAKTLSKSKITISSSGIEELFKLEWQNNIRGLEKFIEELVYHVDKKQLSGQDIVDFINEGKRNQSNMDEIKTFDEYEKEIIENALLRFDGVKNKNDIVADKLGIGRATLYRKIKKYNLT